MKLHDHLGFVTRNSAIYTNIFVPRYYNPEITGRLDELKRTHQLVVLGDLIEQGLLKASSGDEIGKMAYGTGTIPFVRTSDISNWEIKADPKQGVGYDIYVQYADKQDVRAGDLFFVRDGTYLIGSSCLVTDADSKVLFQSHILKFRVDPKSIVSAPLLLALLSCPIVRRQTRAKQFTADIIDSIGNRYRELVLPLPKRTKVRDEISRTVLEVVNGRMILRERLRRIPLWAQGILPDLAAELPSEVVEEQVWENFCQLYTGSEQGCVKGHKRTGQEVQDASALRQNYRRPFAYVWASLARMGKLLWQFL